MCLSSSLSDYWCDYRLGNPTASPDIQLEICMFKANRERMKEFTILCFDGKINPERTVRLKAQQFIEEKHKISVFLFR